MNSRAINRKKNVSPSLPYYCTWCVLSSESAELSAFLVQYRNRFKFGMSWGLAGIGLTLSGIPPNFPSRTNIRTKPIPHLKAESCAPSLLNKFCMGEVMVIEFVISVWQ